YMVSNKYSSRLYFSIGGMIQYSDEKLDLITRLNRNIDKNILRIRLERSDLLLYNYEISIDYSMRYTSFMAEYLHIFTDGARNKTKLYSSLKGDKELLDTREKLLDGIVYLGASGSRYIYDKTKKNSLAFDLTRFEIRGRYDEERESKSYILGYLQRKLFFNVDRVSTVLDLSRVPDAYKECYF
ncbi:MAG: hypothetical protein U9N34_10595, partial [Candidatus Cloacimonadota bacterium]|nr:hypothetical protein [Candidatus Cloacimonadota bacterium]